jgi:tRNA(Ile)-lysidine synthase
MFVRERVEELGLPFHGARWKKPRPGEAAAREARFEFLEQTAKRQRCNAIVLAHHAEDQIETVLLNLGRGAGLRGWLGMSWRREGDVPIVRPLLDVRRAELREVLAECGWDWREDKTNASRRMTRNRLRLDAIPALDQAMPEGWMERFGASLDDLRQVWDPVREAAERVLNTARSRVDSDTIRIDALAGVPEIVQRQALEMWLGPVLSGELTRAHVNTALQMIQNDQTGQRLILPKGWELARNGGQLVRRAPAKASAPRTLGRKARSKVGGKPRSKVGGKARGKVEGKNGSKLRVAAIDLKVALAAVDRRQRKQAGETAATTEPGLIDAAQVIGSFELRPNRPGDRVQLLGAPGSRSIKQILQDRKVAANLRAAWPVVTDEKGIVWVPGIGIADRVRLTSRSRRAMQLQVTQKTSRNGVAGSHPRA